MPDLLAVVEARLRSRAARYGFVGICRSADDSDDGRSGLLEYRREMAGRLPLLLDIILVSEPPRITAELWSPSDLARAAANRHVLDVEDVAICRRTWTIDHDADVGALASEVADEIGAWLASIEPGSPGE